MAKIAATLRGIHNVRSLGSTGKRSVPSTAKSAFLDLFMLQNKKERLLQEKTRIQGRREQVNKEVTTIGKNMDELLKAGTKSMKGEKIKDDSAAAKTEKNHNNSTVLEY